MGHKKTEQSANLQVLYHGARREGGHAATEQEDGNYHHLSHHQPHPPALQSPALGEATPTRQGCTGEAMPGLYKIPSLPENLSSDGSDSRCRIMAC